MEYTGHETILVVDDEPSLSNLLDDMLSSVGYRLIQANSAEHALHILQSNHVDLLISDIAMPGMDGYELAKAVSRQYPEVKVQLVSGYSEIADDDVLHKKVLYKPFKSNDVLMRVRSLLDESR